MAGLETVQESEGPLAVKTLFGHAQGRRHQLQKPILDSREGTLHMPVQEKKQKKYSTCTDK